MCGSRRPGARRRRRAISDTEPGTRDAESKGLWLCGAGASLSSRASHLHPSAHKTRGRGPRASPRGKTAPPRWPDDPGGGWGNTDARGQSIGQRGQPVVSGESVPPPIESAPGPFYSLRGSRGSEVGPIRQARSGRSSCTARAVVSESPTPAWRRRRATDVVGAHRGRAKPERARSDSSRRRPSL